MMRRLVTRVLCCATLASLAVGFAAMEQPTFGADTSVRKLLTKRRRLPARYTHVATQEQQEKLLKIQDEYEPKITALESELKAKVEAMETQLKALRKERDDKMRAVLSPEQQKKMDEMSGKSKAKAAAPAEHAPPAPSTEQKTPK
jgi:Spy/CpxP family protein refolding chaperone